MKITMQTSISGTRNGEDWPPRGETLDLDDAEAAALIAAGHARKVEPGATATAPPAPNRKLEPGTTATAPPAQKRRTGKKST